MTLPRQNRLQRPKTFYLDSQTEQRLSDFCYKHNGFPKPSHSSVIKFALVEFLNKQDEVITNENPA